MRETSYLLIIAAIVLTIMVGGCAGWKEYKYGHFYPAGSGKLVDTNNAPILVPTTIPSNNAR